MPNGDFHYIDYEKIREFEKDAKQGDVDAQYDLGCVYAFGRHGMTQNLKKALEWFHLAAEQEHIEAQSYLAVSYLNGRNLNIRNEPEAISTISGNYVLIDMDKAIRWLERAAEQGDADSLFWLGDLYRFGWSGEIEGRQVELRKNVMKAAELMRLSAEQGESVAMTSIAEMYVAGEGVAQDYVLAYMWYNITTAQGQMTAIDKEKMNKLMKKMTKGQIAEGQNLTREWKPKNKNELPLKYMETTTEWYMK